MHMESDSGRLGALPRAAEVKHPLIRRVYTCRCGRPIFFRNSQCLHCKRALGFDPGQCAVIALEPMPPDAVEAGNALRAVSGETSLQYRRCANFEQPARCNWLISENDVTGNPLCRCCRLNRMVPDLGVAGNAALWHRVEMAKRRLVSSLLALQLPVDSRVSEDPERGLAFDLLIGTEQAKVMTGHQDGIITLNVNEADDATREAVRSAMQEPYRTVLGHLRHESGHYYWARLLDGGPWLEPFRTVFGDERMDYGEALARHHADGAPPDWPLHFVSAYASAHPWEDWAETWAHYLHLIDTLDTALSTGMAASEVDLITDPFGPQALWQERPDDAPDQDFLALMNGWVELTSILNELSRSMGQSDFYPFVLSAEAVRKLHFVHRFLMDHSQSLNATVGAPDSEQKSPGQAHPLPD